jgi:nitrite reductase (NADH) small subunit
MKTLHQVSVPYDSLLPQQGRRVQAGSRELAVFRLEDGEVLCVENRCPHKGGSLAEGIVAGSDVYCTQHDWRICLRDGQAQAPDHGCVRTHPCRVEGGLVHIEVRP